MDIPNTYVFEVSAFKLDAITPTGFKASFLTKHGNTGYYQVLDSTGKAISEQINLSLKTSKNDIQLTNFEYNKLKPNTSYTLVINVTSDDEQSKKEDKLSFVTLQDYPESVKKVELTCNDKVKSTNSSFTLKVTKPDCLGYWKSNSGYDKQLFVNGKLVKTKTEKVKDISESFTIKDEFDYNCKIDDTIQVGIRVWVKDDKGNKLYDASNAKTSKPICLLNKSIVTYLNTN
jgi:hypothetical protein